MPALRPPRVVSVDVLRGLTVAAMILVNDPGDPHRVYRPLRHADWNGYTAADLVFPNFLFLSGVSLAFTLDSRNARALPGDGMRVEMLRAIGRRTLHLIALNQALAAFPSVRLRRIRIFGVLTRTALCGVAGGALALALPSRRGIAAAGAALAAIYTATLLVPLRSGDAVLNRPTLDPDSNLPAALDRLLARWLHGHLHAGALYNVTHDPEGLLGTLSATATVLTGVWAGRVLRDPSLSGAARGVRLLLAAMLSLGVGKLAAPRYPVNKSLWTGSFVAIAAGWSLLALALVYGSLDGPRGSKKLLRAMLPARALGANALTVYALSVMGHTLLRRVHLLREGHSISLRTHLYHSVFTRDKAGGQSTPARSLAFAVVYAGFCLLPAFALWRRRIFIRL